MPTQHNPTVFEKFPDSVLKILWCFLVTKAVINPKSFYANTLNISVIYTNTTIYNFHQIGWLCLNYLMGLTAEYFHTWMIMQKWWHTKCIAVTMVLCNMIVPVFSRLPISYMRPRKLIYFQENESYQSISSTVSLVTFPSTCSFTVE